MTSLLSYGRQTIDDEDAAAVVAALRSDWLTQGPAVRDFENAFAERVGAGFAVACCNGTAALHVAYSALGIAEGDAVVVPSVTFMATAAAARQVGAEVVFADVDPDSGLLTPETFLSALRRADEAGFRVRAVAPVHLAGQLVDMAAIGEIARARGLLVIEDACHAVGSGALLPEGERPTGSCARSDAVVFSFHPVKTMTTAEGGMVTINDPEVARRARRIVNHDIERDPERFVDQEAAREADGRLRPWYHEATAAGFNFRLTDIQAALGLSQLSRLDVRVARRAELVRLYRERLAPFAPTIRPTTAVPGCRPAWHLFTVLFDFAGAGTDRTRVMVDLRERGVGSQVLYIPVHRQPHWRDRYGRPALPGADAHYARALSLPLFPTMLDQDVDRVVEALAAGPGFTPAR